MIGFLKGFGKFLLYFFGMIFLIILVSIITDKPKPLGPEVTYKKCLPFIGSKAEVLAVSLDQSSTHNTSTGSDIFVVPPVLTYYYVLRRYPYNELLHNDEKCITYVNTQWPAKVGDIVELTRIYK